MYVYLRICLLLFVIFASLAAQDIFAQSGKTDRAHKKVEKRLSKWRRDTTSLKIYKAIPVDSFEVSPLHKNIQLFFSPYLSYLPLRESDCDLLNQSVLHSLRNRFKRYSLQIYSGGYLINDLIPNIWRTNMPVDEKRKLKYVSSKNPLARRLDAVQPTLGLNNCNIALWQSHGYFYESSLDRWEFQRARLFGTVEDLYTMTYVLPYLVPMLENAGAEVFLPRERDTQSNEVIVDNATTTNSQFIFSDGLKYDIFSKGFSAKDTLFPGDNLFEQGNSLKIVPPINGTKKVEFIPNIPEKGSYAVYVTYIQDTLNSKEVEYVVQHSGGKTRFLVNQQMGGSTWVYLGTFDFMQGLDAQNGSVSINISGKESGFISADAVRFGGGKGNVARRPANAIVGVNGLSTSNNPNSETYEWKQSGKPRYMEAARYYLQYAGMPDSLVYTLNKNKNDYADDLQSRGEWVNYLIGNSKPQYKTSFKNGLNIPIDLTLAFHTDAGVTPNDSVIGTLGLYSSEKNNGIFPDGQSKLTSRDLTDIIQTQLVDDIRRLYNPIWNRRAMWDRGYSEAFRQIVPAMLLELLSHQNIADMRFGLDPRFRFSASRAIYKGMLKYLSYQQGRPYVIQPLPVDHFSITSKGNKTVVLIWKPVFDSLEISAKPDKYKVYKRVGDGGFDNGTLVEDTVLQVTLENYDQLYSFKVTAVNAGGESFPSEILSAGFKNETASTLLVVNAFDRISGPAIFDTGKMAGIAWWDDQGVPDKSELGFIGNQYDFDRKSEWLDDDSPGWGACYNNMDGKIIPGNSFDFPYIHGKAMLANGYSFVSVSDEVFVGKQFNASAYPIIDVILGEEKSIPNFKNPKEFSFKIYTPNFMDKLKEVTAQGNSVFLSGAYVGTDLLNSTDSIAVKFANDVLHFSWRTNHASKEGEVYATDYAKPGLTGKWSFNAEYDPCIYTVEAPDAIEPEGKGAITAFRYSDSNSSAGVAFQGNYKTLILGFPFETILEENNRNGLMKQVLDFLKK